MKCFNCNTEMHWGNILMKGDRFHWLHGYKKRHLLFDAYDANVTAKKCLEWGKYSKGFYCENCSGVILNSTCERTICNYCGQEMLHGKYHIKKSKMGQLVKNCLNHLYFIEEKNERVIKIIEGDEYTRGLFCENCKITCFNSNESKVH